MKWYFAVLNKYAVFSGRASRTEYWMFMLFHLSIGFALVFIAISPAGGDLIVLGVNLYSLAVLIPGIAVTVRRLHDTGRSGWLSLIALIPIIGTILLLVWLVEDGHPGDNKYGQNPNLLAEATATVVCPFCAEEHKTWATVCKHCGTDLPKLIISHD